MDTMNQSTWEAEIIPDFYSGLYLLILEEAETHRAAKGQRLDPQRGAGGKKLVYNAGYRRRQKGRLR